MDGHLDLEPAPVLGHQARLITNRRRIPGKPLFQVGRKLLAFFGGRQVYQRGNRQQLFARVPGQLHVGVVARDVAPGLGDDEAFAEIADGEKKRRLTIELHAEVAVDGSPGEESQQSQRQQDERPDGDRTERDHERDNGVDPYRAEAGKSDGEEQHEMLCAQTELEVEEDGGERGCRQRGQVVAQPGARHAEHEHGEDRADEHEQQLDREVGGES